jgi:hypothetical protein
MDPFKEALKKAQEVRSLGQRRHDNVYASDASVEIQIGEDVEVHGSCLRNQYYRITEEPISDPEDATTSFVAQVGNAVHEAVAHTFRAAEQLVEEETRIWIPEIKLSGRIDLIVRPDHGRKVGIEVKSVGGYYGCKGVIKTTRDTPLYPKLYHLAQAVVYADHLQKSGVKEWMLLYVDRESGAFQGHSIQYEAHDEIYVNGEPSAITPERVFARWHRLWEHVEAKTPPKRDYSIQFTKEQLMEKAEAGKLNKADTEKVKKGKMIDKGDMNCRWCRWATTCWSADE